MNLFSLALRNLRQRPVRTGLVVLGIAVAVGSALALLALSRSVQAGVRDSLDEIGGDLIVMPKNVSAVFGGFIPESVLDRIGTISGIARVSGALIAFAPSGAAENALVIGWPGGSFLWKKVPLREGRVPAEGERRVAVLGDTAAAALGKKLDDELDLFGQS